MLFNINLKFYVKSKIILIRLSVLRLYTPLGTNRKISLDVSLAEILKRNFQLEILKRNFQLEILKRNFQLEEISKRNFQLNFFSIFFEIFWTFSKSFGSATQLKVFKIKKFFRGSTQLIESCRFRGSFVKIGQYWPELRGGTYEEKKDYLKRA